MVERDEGAGAGRFDQPHAFLPGRVAPTHIVRVLGVGVGGIVDHDVGALDQIEDRAVGLARRVLGIRDIAQRAPVELDAIAGRVVRVVQRRGADDHVVARGQPVAGAEFVIGERRAHVADVHGLQRIGEETGEHVVEPMLRAQMPGPHVNRLARVLQAAEIRPAVDVIEVGVGEQHVHVERRLAQRAVERAQARSGVQNEQTVAAAHLQTARVAAIADRVRPRTRDAAAHAPETDEEIALPVHSGPRWRVPRSVPDTTRPRKGRR